MIDFCPVKSVFFKITIAFIAAYLASCGDYRSELLEPNAVSDTTSIIKVDVAAREDFDFVEAENSPVSFTEVDQQNVTVKDEDDQDPGWIELYNKSSKPFDLRGFSLTDDLEKPHKWTFEKAVIPAKSRILVFLSGKNRRDYVPPTDSTNVFGEGCWTWTDAGWGWGGSTIELLPGADDFCFTQNGVRMFGARMQFAENPEKKRHDITLMIGTIDATPEGVMDLSKVDEFLLTGYVTKKRRLSVRLVQLDIYDIYCYEQVLVGTGDSNTTYAFKVPTGTNFPDLANIFGTRFSPALHETEPVEIKIRSFIARKSGAYPHASFKLNDNGGNLFLSDSAGTVYAYVFYPNKRQGKTWSAGKNIDGKTSWGYADATPLEKTADTVATTISPSMKNFMPPSGFYSTPFLIDFPEEWFVRCNSHGKLPTQKNSLVYKKYVDSTMVLRCASFVPGTMPGQVETRTYVFENAPTIPAVFVTADDDALFSADSGIYTTGKHTWENAPYYGANYWAETELPAFVELMEPGSKTPAFAENAGYSIFGTFSRILAKKSGKITFREKYGKKRLDYPLFPDAPDLTSFKSFVLRNNGNGFGQTYFLDRLASSVTEGLGVDYQRGRAVVVFYNGAYYGLHNLRETCNEYYFETHYGYDPNNIDLLDPDDHAVAGHSSDYVDLRHYVTDNSLKKDSRYRKVIAQMDVNNFMNYMQSEIFANNRDWPANNLKKWRRSDTKSPWKWFLYDLDFGYGNGYGLQNNIFEYVINRGSDSLSGNEKSTVLLRRLLENKEFYHAFVNRMTTLLSMNFESSRLLKRFDELQSEIASEISRDQGRWFLDAGNMSENNEKIRRFAQTRQRQVLDEMIEYFGLGHEKSVTLESEGPGRISVHGLPLDRASIKVTFFKKFPVTLTAIPDEGGVFIGWSDGVKDEVREIMPENVTNITAKFR